MPKKSDIISQAAAAKLAKVTKQAISKLIGHKEFFTSTKPAKVDTSHPEWGSYLKEKLNTDVIRGNTMKALEGEFFDILAIAPTTPTEAKTTSDTILKIIQIHENLNNLIDKSIVVSYHNTLNRLIQSNFVDTGKRTSAEICAKLGCPGMEKVVEAIINKEIRKGIESVQTGTKKVIDQWE